MKPKKLVFMNRVAMTPIGDYKLFSWDSNTWMALTKDKNKNIVPNWASSEAQAIQAAQSHFDKLAWSCFDRGE